MLALGDERPLPVAELRKRFEHWLPAYMAGARLGAAGVSAAAP